MTIAEEVASLWSGVKQMPVKGAEKAYYADLLRWLMQSKKQLEETGRKYSILPELRELTRRTMVRIPAEHVAFLEVSVFDLISNPLKKNLQPYVSEFSASGADLDLVSWFVRHAKKEPALALDVKALQEWLDKVVPVQSAAPNTSEPVAQSSSESQGTVSMPQNPQPQVSGASSPFFSEDSALPPAPADDSLITSPPAENEGSAK